MFEEFDKYVKKNNIKPEEMGEAFAAFLNLQFGWDGKSEKLDNDPR